MAIFKIVNGRPTLNIGSLRHTITIQTSGPTSPPTTNAAGPVLTWTTLTTAQAAIEMVRGTDVIKGGQIATQLYLTLALWYVPGVAPNMQVVSDNGSTYVIQSVENVLEMNVVLVLNCLGLGLND